VQRATPSFYGGISVDRAQYVDSVTRDGALGDRAEKSGGIAVSGVYATCVR